MASGQGGGFRGGWRGGMQRGGRGTRRGGDRGGRGGFRGPMGPPSSIVVAGEVMHACENQLLVKSLLNQQVPYFNGRVFLENKQEIGKVDEILGPINEFYFSIKLDAGIKAESFNSSNTKFFVDQQQVLPLSRFLPKPVIQKGEKKKVKPSGSYGTAVGGKSMLRSGASRGSGSGRGISQFAVVRGRGGSGASRGGRGISSYQGAVSRH